MYLENVNGIPAQLFHSDGEDTALSVDHCIESIVSISKKYRTISDHFTRTPLLAVGMF